MISKDWKEELVKGEKGEIKANIHNYRLILENDPNITGSVWYDTARHCVVVSGDLPWTGIESHNENCWAESDDEGLRKYLREEYGVSSFLGLEDAKGLAVINMMRI